jgi:glycosyltransferase involved in cell wall biosynthesis
MTLHIGIASYENPGKLQESIAALIANTVGDWKLLVVDNASSDPEVRTILETYQANDPRITVEFRTDNIGYAGAVNRIIAWADSEGADRVSYCDNDAIVNTPGWNVVMSDVLDRNHQVAMAVVTKFAAFPVRRPTFVETTWGVGCFWMQKRPKALQPPKDIGPWDESLGHQDEVDAQLRMRLEGWAIAAVDIDVVHEAKATTTPEAQDRISAGVINFMNKWLRYFVGPNITYWSPNVVRFDDWNINALHIEAYFQQKQQEGKLTTGLNDHPEEFLLEGRRFQWIKVPRWPDLYKDRFV